MLSLKKLFLSIVIPTSFLLLPVTVFANSIFYFQPDYSNTLSTVPNTLSYDLGNGISGDLTTGAVQVYMRYNYFGSGAVIRSAYFAGFASSSYSGDPVASCFMGNQTISPGEDFDNLLILDDPTGDCVFNPALYYKINYEISGIANDSFYTKGNSGGSPFLVMAGDPTDITPAVDTRTRILSFTPEEGTTTGNNVNFSLHAYINPDDIANVLGVQLTFKNIDQNTLLSYIPFISHDFTIFAGQATTSGDFYVATTTSLPDGNYRVQASIKRTLIGTFVNPFSNINDTQNHQFVVNEGSYIGHLNQNGFDEFNSIFGSTTATSTAASSLNCNPVTFSINLCLAFLFIPGGPQLDQTIQSFQDGIATRWPWGYFYRVYSIMNGAATSSLPSFTADIVIGPPDNLATTSLTYDPGDMLAGAGSLLDSVHDNQHGKSFREVMEPFVLLTVALAVLFTIFADISGSHKHSNTNMPHGKLS